MPHKDPIKAKKCRDEWAFKNRERLKEYKSEYHKQRWLTDSEFRRRAKERNVRRTYGISLEQYESMLVQQDSRCAICHEPFCQDSFGSQGRGKPHLDHSHESGALRQFLCGLCNKGLGQFRDSVEWLEAAAEYLKSHQEVR